MSTIDANPEVTAFSSPFNAANVETLGDARLSIPERQALTARRKEVAEMFPNDHMKARDLFLERLWTEGYPVPEEVTAEMIGEIGARHSCVVAEYLLTTRGIDAYPMTYWSYSVKNAADRQIAWILKNLPEDLGSGFWTDWKASRPRDPYHENPNVKYPESVDDSQIYGIAKVHRYWPAQLLRYMEAVRLDKVSEQEVQRLKLEGVDRDLYHLDWRDPWLTEALQDVKNVNDVPVNIALKVIEIMRERGVDDGQIIALMLAGYSPGGPIFEHGFIPEIWEIWVDILDRLEEADTNVSLVSILSESLYQSAMSKLWPIGLKAKRDAIMKRYDDATSKKGDKLPNTKYEHLVQDILALEASLHFTLPPEPEWQVDIHNILDSLGAFGDLDEEFSNGATYEEYYEYYLKNLPSAS